jgi:hypothetical protein
LRLGATLAHACIQFVCFPALPPCCACYRLLWDGYMWLYILILYILILYILIVTILMYTICNGPCPDSQEMCKTWPGFPKETHTQLTVTPERPAHAHQCMHALPMSLQMQQECPPTRKQLTLGSTTCRILTPNTYNEGQQDICMSWVHLLAH